MSARASPRPHWGSLQRSPRLPSWFPLRGRGEWRVGGTRGEEEGKGGERGNGEGRGNGGSWGNSALVVGGIDAPEHCLSLPWL